VKQPKHCLLSPGPFPPPADAFSFIDTDGSGVLDKDELRDGFAAMGVNLAENVAEELMQLLDADGNGTVDYEEFVSTLFPAARYN
jgi:calmodulin